MTMRRTCWTFFVWVGGAWLIPLACGGSSADVGIEEAGTGDDATSDATVSEAAADDATGAGDVEGDAGSGEDASDEAAAVEDAEADASPDAPIDAPMDAPMDAKVDSPQDAALDASADDASPDDASLDDASVADGGVDAAPDAGFCAGKDDGTPCSASAGYACCSGTCKSLTSKSNCGGCNLACSGSCALVGVLPNRGYVCTCSNSSCPVGQACFVTPGTDTCNCQGADGGGCAEGQTCKASTGIPTRYYCSY